MSCGVLGYSLGDKASPYIQTAAISGLAALATRSIGFPAISFALTVLGILSSSQAAIHVGKENLWSSRAIKTFDALGLVLAVGGTIAMPITVGWGIWSVLCAAQKVKYACSLIASLAAAKFLEIPKFP